MEAAELRANVPLLFTLNVPLFDRLPPDPIVKAKAPVLKVILEAIELAPFAVALLPRVTGPALIVSTWSTEFEVGISGPVVTELV